MACIQETQWKGSGCKFCGAKGKRYNLFLMAGEERSDFVGIFAEKWLDNVVSVKGWTVLLVSKGTVKEY